MVRRINVDGNVFVDLDKFSDMLIEPTRELGKSDSGSDIVITSFQVVGIHDNGSKVILFKKDKKDECTNYIMKNWMK